MTAKIDFRPLVIQRFIDAVLYLNREISTVEIKNVFGVKQTTASLAMKVYRDTKPETAMIYSGYEKKWKATADWTMTDEFWPGGEHPIQFLKAIKTVYGVTVPMAP